MAGYGIQKRGSGKALKKRKHFDAGGLALQDLVNNKITENILSGGSMYGGPQQAQGQPGQPQPQQIFKKGGSVRKK
jgi:hypothetical protein